MGGFILALAELLMQKIGCSIAGIFTAWFLVFAITHAIITALSHLSGDTLW
jgi:hypothetical protein